MSHCCRCHSCRLLPDPTHSRAARVGYLFTITCHLLAWGALGLVAVVFTLALIVHAFRSLLG